MSRAFIVIISYVGGDNVNIKALAFTAAAGAVLSLEAISLYHQVMGRGDRPKSLVAKLLTKEDADKNRESDSWRKKYVDWADNEETERCMITSDRGDVLRGYYFPPDNPSDVIVIGSHGFHADHTVDPYTFIKHYHDRGYGFFCCDHVASGESSGNYVGFDYFESRDMLLWIDYLKARFGKNIKIILHGVSMGASTVLQLADKCPDCVKLIISDCAYTGALDEFEHVVKSVGIRVAKPFVWIFNKMNIRFAGFDFKDTDVRKSVSNAKVPVLFIHGKQDDLVPLRMANELYSLCGSPLKKLKIFENASHAESLMKNEKDYLKTVDDFIDNNLK